MVAYILIVPVTYCSSHKDPGPPPLTPPPSSDSGHVVLPGFDTAPGADVRHIPQINDPKPDATDKFETLSCGDLAGTWTVILDSNSKKRNDEWTFQCSGANTVSIAFGKNNQVFKSSYPPENGQLTSSQANFSVKTLDYSYTIALNKQEGKITGTAVVKHLGSNYAPETHSVQLKKK